MSPYVSDLAGSPGPNVAGFDRGEWADPTDNNQYKGSANVFALMNTDEGAGRILTQAAIAEQLASEGRYAADPTGSDSRAELERVGRLHGLIDRGVLEAVQDQYDDKAAHAQVIYDRKEAAFTALSTMGSFGIDKLPGGEFVNLMIDSSGNSLQSAMIGKPPGGADQAALNPPDFQRDTYNILRAVPEMPMEIRDQYGKYFDESGQLMSWNEMVKTEPDDIKLGADCAEMFEVLGGTDADGILHAYQIVVLTDG